MEPTVLAGAIEFSPAAIALIIAVIVAGFIVVTAPGWAVLAYVMGRLPAPGATQGRRWAARVTGAGAGLAISAAVGGILGSVQGIDPLICVPIAWIACWVLAAFLHRRAPAPVLAPLTPPVGSGLVSPPAPSTTGQGWGR